MNSIAGYQILGELYRGSDTLILRAMEQANQRPVLLKTLVGEAITPEKLFRLHHQYSLTQGLSHGGLLTCYDLEYWQNKPVLILEDCQGIVLEQYRSSHDLTLQDCLEIALQLADILQLLFQYRICHNAIHAGHILVEPQSRQIRLIDFSQAHFGKPDQAKDFQDLGKLLLQLLAGPFVLPSWERPPSTETSPGHVSVMPEVNSLPLPSALLAILQRLLEDRGLCQYPNALSLQRDLRHCLTQLAQTGRLAHHTVAPELPQRKNALTLASLLPRFEHLAAILDPQESLQECFRCLMSDTDADRCALAQGCQAIALNDAQLNESLAAHSAAMETSLDDVAIIDWVQEQNTALKQAEEASRNAQQLLQLVLDTIPQKVFWKDRDSRYLGCNRLFAEVAGLASPVDIVGKTDYDLPWKRAESDFFIACDQRVMNSGQAELGIVESQLTATGQETWVETNKAPLYNAEHQVIGILGTYQDITSRKEAEKTLQRLNEELELRVVKRTRELQESQQFLQLIMDTIPLAIFWKDRDSVYLGCNREALYTTGLSQLDDIVGKTDYDLPWKLEVAEQIRRGDREVMERNAAALRIEESLTQTDGNPAWLETSKVPIHDMEGKVMGILATFQDITSRKQAEASLQQLNGELREAKEVADAASLAKSEFLASMSHELRTPLNGILGYAQILQRSETLTAKEQHGVRVIQESGEHLLTLINEVLDLAKIEAGKLTLKPEATELIPLLRGVLEICRLQAEQKGVIFQAHLDEALHQWVIVDEKSLRQVLLNLLSNAVKFTEEGYIKFRVECTSLTAPGASQHWDDAESAACQIDFSICDTGVGIAEQDLGRIFQSFEQVGEERQKAQGSGLGLAISQQIVQLMGGEIQVVSQPGEGSEFFFAISLPLVQGEAAASVEGGRVVAYKGDRRHILVVDDNVKNCELLQAYLEPLGFTVSTACDGIVAWEEINRDPPDLAIMDIIMPRLDGHGLLQKLRADARFVKLPVIVSSASVGPEDQSHCLALGANAFLSKPVKLDSLLEMLRQHLKLHWQLELSDGTDLPALDLNAALSIPPAETLQQVFEFLSLGRLQKIYHYLDQQEVQDPQYSAFFNEIRSLAQQFDLDQLEALLAEHLARS